MTNLNGEKFFFFDRDCSNMVFFPESIEHAYLAILNDELETSKLIFSRLDSPRANWGKVFVSILQGFMPDYPTYFGIRNFLEIDVDFLLKNNKISYVEQFLGSIDILATINQESYKYTGRVMLENGLYTAGLKYLDKSKQIFYNDPELHYIYAKYYLDKKMYSEAYFYINECLKLLPSYYPAILIKEKIEEIGF